MKNKLEFLHTNCYITFPSILYDADIVVTAHPNSCSFSRFVNTGLQSNSVM